jgi:hypothetical protein
MAIETRRMAGRRACDGHRSVLAEARWSGDVEREVGRLRERWAPGRQCEGPDRTGQQIGCLALTRHGSEQLQQFNGELRHANRSAYDAPAPGPITAGSPFRTTIAAACGSRAIPR